MQAKLDMIDADVSSQQSLRLREHAKHSVEQEAILKIKPVLRDHMPSDIDVTDEHAQQVLLQAQKELEAMNLAKVNRHVQD